MPNADRRFRLLSQDGGGRMNKSPGNGARQVSGPDLDRPGPQPDLSGRSVIVERLRLAREMVGLSQGQIARLMDMHRPTVSEIEAGRRRVGADELKEFARHYHTSVAWLTGEEPVSADLNDESIKLAAKELEKLSADDLQRVLRVIGAIRSSRHDAGTSSND